MRIAIIDDGIASEALQIPIKCLMAQNGVITEKNEIITKFSHGTMCAKIALKNITEVDVISISIYSEFDNGKEEDLITALRWCIRHHVDLINLSNGITSFFHNEEINNVCYQLWNSGTIITAGVSNDWKYTIPAHLPYVVSVSKKRFIYNYFCKADRHLSGYARYTDRNGKKHYEAHNSFACAKMTNILLRNKNVREKWKKYVSESILDFSLLKDAYVWGLDYLNHQLLVFKPKDFEKDVSSTRYVLIVIDGIRPYTVLHRLRRMENKPQLIIWCCSKIPLGIKLWCINHSIRCWERPRRAMLSFRSNVAQKIKDCFLIGVIGDNNLCCSAQTKSSFEESGYTALLFSEEKNGCLYGSVMSIDPKVIKKACSAIDPDIILIDMPNSMVIKCDAYLEFSKEKILLKGDGKTISINRTATNEEYRKIVQNLESIIEGSEVNT